MCVLVHCDGRLCETRGDLATALDLSTALGASLVRKPTYAGPTPKWDDCLCSVDIEATCDAAGYDVERDGGGNWLACQREE